ncbi:MAG: bifunctional (p)ppGpp synthetase/guanosine-3',5'-bis(diphosphate) 3'-pyrophosphohydrolase [Spirochaetales bacterium]|nr:bifunctional (p)ppGpp synthetase/guanosine-3',5'-bis(diphosphate) 3'-pyrophosphohydrolase [Spirochaetales bacterium]
MADGSDDKLILSTEDVDQLISDFESTLIHYTLEERKEIMRAVHWARKLHMGQKRASGEPYIIHPVESTGVLVELQLDATTIIASLLHDVLEDTDIEQSVMKEEFGEEVAMLVDGVTKIDIMEVGDKALQKIETLRKMIFAIVKDIRVIFIKLADKRHNMSTLNFVSPQKQKRIARECLEIYAPLAGRLGINTVKMELEDLSLKYLHPLSYVQIKTFIDQKKVERADYLAQVKQEIEEAAGSEGVTGLSVETRAKHFYSIYRKMKSKGKDLDEIYDLLGVRILCRSKIDCYHILGIIHQLWPPIEGRFKDYIAMPKANDYQSLHTTVRCNNHRPLEIQIRTFTMDETANFGVAAHFLYKEGHDTGGDDTHKKDIDFVQKLKNWNLEDYSSNEFMDSIKRDLLQDTIIVYTPKGQPVVLPKGSTAIDFAYHIHSDIGDHCVRARANGSIIPLTKPLKNTQTVEVMTHPEAHPHQNWLKYTKSHRARDKIRHWINKHNEDYIIEGNIIARPGRDKKELGKPLAPQKVEEKEKEGTYSPEQKVLDQEKVTISLNRERNMMIKLSHCCSPTPGDDIIGYVTRGRGITVHRKDCPNLKGIDDFENRKVEVAWETSTNKYSRSFHIIASRTVDLFSEIEGAIKKHGGHLIAGSVNESDRGNLEGHFTVEMEKKSRLAQISKSIRTIPSVFSLYESPVRFEEEE